MISNPKSRPVFWDSASWRIAAVDLVIARCAPAAWPLEKRQRVVKQLRQGLDPAEIARTNIVPLPIVERLKKLAHCQTVGDVLRTWAG